MAGYGVNWIGGYQQGYNEISCKPDLFVWSYGLVEGSCEKGNELLDCINDRDFLTSWKTAAKHEDVSDTLIMSYSVVVYLT